MFGSLIPITITRRSQEPHEPIRMAPRPSNSDHSAPGDSLDLHHLHHGPKPKASRPLALGKPIVIAAFHICYIIYNSMGQNPISGTAAHYAPAAFLRRSKGAAGTLPGNANESFPLRPSGFIHAGGNVGKNKV